MAPGNLDRRFALNELVSLATELVKQNVNVIVAFGTPPSDAARRVTATLRRVGLMGVEDLERIFAQLQQDHVEALRIQSDSVTDQWCGRIAELAKRYRLPTILDSRLYVEAGGLMSYGPSVADIHRRAATYVDKILKGAKPADLPIEQPSKFELVVNLKTAKAIGLTIPQSLLIRADEVIQ